MLIHTFKQELASFCLIDGVDNWLNQSITVLSDQCFSHQDVEFSYYGMSEGECRYTQMGTDVSDENLYTACLPSLTCLTRK